MSGTLRFLAVAWWLHLKSRSRSAFDGLLSVVWPLFFATAVLLMYRAGNAGDATLVAAVVGAAAMGVWSATTLASSSIEEERAQGTLELQVGAPRSFTIQLIPIMLSMTTVGLYSLVAVFLWGRFVFGIEIVVASVPAFLVAIAVTVFSIAMLGFLLAVSAVRYRAAWALGAALELPIWLLCGFLVPVSALPGWVQPLSWLLAPTWGVSALRAAVAGHTAVDDLLRCLGLGVAYILIGAVQSHRLVRSARRHATLALT
ncbi:ABC transporter permease [Catenuloplanes atrovinosus]|uniref:ABC-2 type transport system permease protein n=1 Tax=Catenuloplanes atrovinosus TaxID=137266 RepID=A0AAE4C8J4_9ACTN|nr:ABC transporter permease [Catenuloplanes atrovinosus]MDR7275591.1 ABC-2 type transport system permease protein [Catenuloplanes atrovinosus]